MNVALMRSSLPLIGLMTMAVALVHDAAYSMLMLWLTTDTYMHGAFVIPMAALMAYHKPKPTAPPSACSWLMALLLSLLWGAGVAVGHLAMLNVIQQAMLFALIPLLVTVFYGPRIAWHYRAPLILLFFAVPVGDFLIPYLQSITAEMSVFMLRMSGVSVVHNGWYISIPAADFRVAEACSGINFLISTFTVAVFYAFTYMEKIHKRAAFVLMGLLVPLVANGLRVYLIILIADMGNVEAATGFDHLVYGWIFFVVILVALFAIGHFWQDPPAERDESAVRWNEMLRSLRFSGARYYSVVATMLMVASLLIWQGSAKENPVSVRGHGKPLHENDPLGPDFPAADSVTIKRVDGWSQYRVFYQNETVDKKIIGYQNRWFDLDTWSVESWKNVQIEGQTLQHWSLINLAGERAHMVRGFCVAQDWKNSTLAVKMAQVKSRLFAQDFGATAYMWFRPIQGSQDASLPTLTLQGLCPAFTRM